MCRHNDTFIVMMSYTNTMKFIREGSERAVQAMTERIAEELQTGHTVLWLVSGGSNVAPQCQVMTGLGQLCTPEQLSQLTIMPVDERYGPTGHADSNYAQMRQAGFEPNTARWIDVLADNISFDDTVRQYDDVLRQSYDTAHIVVATLGLGTDAHTAGVLPGSPAVESTDQFVVGYAWTDYQRMTSSLIALRRIAIVWLLAYGEAKAEALRRLYDNVEPLRDLPSVLLYELPEVYVYNDAIESEGIS